MSFFVYRQSFFRSANMKNIGANRMEKTGWKKTRPYKHNMLANIGTCFTPVNTEGYIYQKAVSHWLKYFVSKNIAKQKNYYI